MKSRWDFFGVVVLNAVVGLRDECLAQAQAGKAQISLADLMWRGDHLLQSIHPVQSDGSQIAGLPLHRLVGAGSRPLWCFIWAIDELAQAE